ncbi:hypothetical protein OOU_Y34scaffold00590g68 [Pyricularia oryzae Y34]|nr:hypothetical protein OOU_Y34scaffold00590g68 [Pyricularia oryzae Y34]
MFLIPELVGDELHRKEGVCGKYLLAAVCFVWAGLSLNSFQADAGCDRLWMFVP